MNQHLPGQKTVMFTCGYAGDKDQIKVLRPMYEHHKLPLVILSPSDSQIHGIGPHICRHGGKRAYIGQDSLDRQYEHFKIMLDYEFDFVLMNDSDSFVIEPNLPQYLYDNPDTVFSNQVDDFRKPGQIWPGNKEPWPDDYHAGYPLIAMQPPYFFSRVALEKIVATCKGIVACPICPFIDWYFVQVVYKAGLKHAPFKTGASCETVTPLGRRVMEQCIVERGATFLHAIKSQPALDICKNAYKRRNGSNR
jgi:hypothetical protein